MPSSNIWVGGYTDDMGGSALGIGLLRASGGSLTWAGVAAATDSPSYLTRFADTIYAVGEGSSTVTAFGVHGSELHLAGLQYAAGALPCAATVVGGSYLVVSCYGDGTIDVHPLAGGVGKTSQSIRAPGEGGHAHAALQIDESRVLTTDLGADRVYVHSLGDGLTRIGAIDFPPGCGPRDLMLHPSGAVWMLAELSNEIFAISGSSVSGPVALPGREADDHAAGLAISADGRFAYSALRGSNRVAVLSASPDGALTPLTSVDCGGGWPRHLIVSGEYLHVANQLSNSVTTFRIGEDGVPSLCGTADVPSPTFLLAD